MLETLDMANGHILGSGPILGDFHCRHPANNALFHVDLILTRNERLHRILVRFSGD